MYDLDAVTAHSIAQPAIERLRRFIKRHYANKQAVAFGKPIKPISKDSKHRAYGDADYIVRHLRLQVPRAHDVAGLEAILTAAVRWTPAQYLAAADVESVKEAENLARHLAQVGRRLAELGFETAGDMVATAAYQLDGEVDARRVSLGLEEVTA